MRQIQNYKLLFIYCLLIFSGTIAFFYYRSFFHEAGRYQFIWYSAFLYAFFMFTTGFLFGRYRYRHGENHDTGFYYHVASYVLFNGIWLIWIKTGLSTPQDSYMTVLLVMFAWGLGLFLHFYFYLINRRKMIRGIYKDEIFE